MRSEQRTAIVTFPFSDKAALHREKRLRLSNKRRLYHERPEILQTCVCGQHLKARWLSPDRKGNSVRTAACAGNVCGKCHAGHADCERRCLQRRGIHRHRHGAAHSGGNAGCRYRHAHSALPRLAYRFAAAGRDGLELYIPFCHDDACREGLWSDDRSRHCRRLRRRACSA